MNSGGERSKLLIEYKAQIRSIIFARQITVEAIRANRDSGFMYGAPDMILYIRRFAIGRLTWNTVDNGTPCTAAPTFFSKVSREETIGNDTSRSSVHSRANHVTFRALNRICIISKCL
ncbi:hypothetical protein ACS0PU_001912 [Formica fusca]